MDQGHWDEEQALELRKWRDLMESMAGRQETVPQTRSLVGNLRYPTDGRDKDQSLSAGAPENTGG